MLPTPVPVASARRPTRTERLDSLPFTRKHARMLGASGIGWALDAMDVGLVSFLIAALAVHWQLTLPQQSLVASAGFVGMAIGAVVGGMLADRIGRRQVFALTLLIYGLATGASALATGLGVLVALRVLVGIGLGAELPVASTLMSEFAPRRIRGRVVVWLEAFWALGWILAAVVGASIVASGPTGWRWALALGAVPAVYAIIIRWGMPESVRYLEGAGRHEEAEATVRSFERSALADGADRADVADGARSGDGSSADAAAADDDAAPEVLRAGRASLWSPELRGRTLALWAVWAFVNLAYYGAFIWIPSLLVSKGYDLAHSFAFTLIITLAQIPGYAASAWLIEVIGRRWTLCTFLLGSAIAALVFGAASTVPVIILGGCLLSFFNLGAWGALYAITPEIYPTSVRGSGAGAAAACGRLASIASPLLVPALLVQGGVGVVFAVIAAAFVLGGVAAFLLPEKQGEALA